MSLKLKIVLFISILVILSLGTTLLFLSYYEYKPALKNEIIRRIDYQLDHITARVVLTMRGESKYDVLDVPLFSILDRNKEVLYLKILKGSKNKNLRYFGVITKNRIIYQLRNEEKKITYHNEFVKKLRGKKVIDTCNIIKLATSKTNNTLNTEIPVYRTVDLKYILEEEEKKYKTAVSNIDLMITEVENRKSNTRRKRIRKISQPKLKKEAIKIINPLLVLANMYDSKLKKILSKTKDNSLMGKIDVNIRTIAGKDLRDLARTAFPEVRSRIRRDKFSWQIRNLRSVNKILKRIHSRLEFINDKLLSKVSTFHKTVHDFSNSRSQDKKKVPEESINIIRFFKKIEMNLET